MTLLKYIIALASFSSRMSKKGQDSKDNCLMPSYRQLNFAKFEKKIKFVRLCIPKSKRNNSISAVKYLAVYFLSNN